MLSSFAFLFAILGFAMSGHLERSKKHKLVQTKTKLVWSRLDDQKTMSIRIEVNFNFYIKTKTIWKKKKSS